MKEEVANGTGSTSAVDGWSGKEFMFVHCQLLGEGLRAAAGLVPLKALKPNFLHFLFANAQVQTLFRGQVLFERQSFGRKHFYLLHGRLELSDAAGSAHVVTGSEGIFPLSPRKPRAYDAVALTDCSVLSVDSQELDRILTWSQVAEYLMAKISVQRDYDEDTAWMQTVLSSNLFLKVPPVNVEEIYSRLTPMVVLRGETIIREGEIGDSCYFIKEGSAQVSQRAGQGATLPIADIGVGRCFGEDALVYDTVRNASVTMTSDGVLMRLQKRDFMLLLKEPEVPELPLSALTDTNALALIDIRTEDEYAAGHLPAAANIPLSLLSLKKRLLAPEKHYLIYCDTGRRSRAAVHLLREEGYSVSALAGGLDDADLDGQLSPDHDYILRGGEVISSS